MTDIITDSNWTTSQGFNTLSLNAFRVNSPWSQSQYFNTQYDELDLYHTPAKILSVWLQDKGVLPKDQAKYWFPYVGYLPEQFHNTPAVLRNCISMIDSGDDSNGRWLRRGDYFLRYLVQIRVRGLDYVETWHTIKRIDKVISRLISVPVTVDDKHYIIRAISRTTGVVPMGIDPGQQTYNFSLNTSGVYIQVSTSKGI
jgi:hypothetical protein